MAEKSNTIIELHLYSLIVFSIMEFLVMKKLQDSIILSTKHDCES